MNLGTVHFLQGRGGWWDLGGHQKNGLEGGGHLKKIRQKGGHVKYYLYWSRGRGKNLVTGGVMQLSNETSKNSTSPPTS